MAPIRRSASSLTASRTLADAGQLTISDGSRAAIRRAMSMTSLLFAWRHHATNDSGARIRCPAGRERASDRHGQPFAPRRSGKLGARLGALSKADALDGRVHLGGCRYRAVRAV